MERRPFKGRRSKDRGRAAMNLRGHQAGKRWGFGLLLAMMVAGVQAQEAAGPAAPEPTDPIVEPDLAATAAVATIPVEPVKAEPEQPAEIDEKAASQRLDDIVVTATKREKTA